MLGCTGVETYILESTALWSKRAQKHCDLMRKMFEALDAGKGKHLLSLVKPHFESCGFCQSWAQVNEKDFARIFRRVKKYE